MWSYYGNAKNRVDAYPKPKFNKIIEPFAGSAQYSLKYFENDILLVDKYPVIIKIWHFLQQASAQDVLRLPRMKTGEKLDDYNFDCEGEKLLMSFLIGFGSAAPRKTVTKKLDARPNFINFNLQKIAGNLFKIKHWVIRQGSFESIDNIEATWFLDAPYQHGGHIYIESNKNIDFPTLAKWPTSRAGQLIVCENDKANWLPFKPMVSHKTLSGQNKEVIYTNLPSAFDHIQQTIF